MKIDLSAINDQDVLVGDWITRTDSLYLCGLPCDRSFDLELRLRGGGSELYEYFPFMVEFNIKNNRSELYEIGGKNQEFTVSLEDLRANHDGELHIQIRSECASNQERNGNEDVREMVAFCISARAIHASQTTDRVAKPAISRSIFSAPFGLSERSGPIFVTGCYRSGTSITTWALGQHPNILPLEETGWLRCTLLGAAAGHYQAQQPSRNAPSLYDIDEDAYLQWIGQSLDDLHHSIGRDRATRILMKRLSGPDKNYHPQFRIIRSARSPKTRWIDGTPENTGVMPLLGKAFPTAKFLVMVRDPLSVITSLLHFDRLTGQNYSIERSLRFWMQMTELGMRAAEAMGPERVKVVIYDDLTADPKLVLRQIFDFLEESNFITAANTFSTRINSSQVQPEDKDKIQASDIGLAPRIYKDILEGKTASQIDWGKDSLGSIEEIKTDMIDKIIRAVSG